jgi:hypothetical protein
MNSPHTDDFQPHSADHSAPQRFHLDKLSCETFGDLLSGDYSRVWIDTSPKAHRLAARAGALALACDDTIYFGRGAYQPDSLPGRRLLAHELAHTKQQKGSRPLLDSALQLELEHEADDAAAALLRGQSVRISPRAACPPELPAIPLIVWGLIAAAVGLGIVSAFREEDIKEDAKKRDDHLYETGWGYVPLVGSVDQVLNGRSVAQRAIGTVFLVLDVSLVGGVVVKGVAFSLRGFAGLALREIAEGGGEAGQKVAFNELRNAGVKFGSREAVTSEILKTASTTPVVLANSEGLLNHSVTYIIKGGKIWKIHGGPLQLFFREAGSGLGRDLTEAELKKIVGRTNALTMYRVSASSADLTLQFWEREIAKGRLSLFLKAQGCASTQAMLIEGLKIEGVNSALRAPAFTRYAPLLPFFYDSGRMLGPGAHELFADLPRYLGTTFQLGLLAGPREGFWKLNSMYSRADTIMAQSLAVSSILQSSEHDPVYALQLDQVIDDDDFATELWDPPPMMNLSGPMNLALPIDVARGSSDGLDRWVSSLTSLSRLTSSKLSFSSPTNFKSSWNFDGSSWTSSGADSNATAPVSTSSTPSGKASPAKPARGVTPGTYTVTNSTFCIQPNSDSPMVCTPTQQKTYTVGRGEGWMHIAQRVYGDPSKFTDIAAANGKKTTDTIHPGDVLVIP